MISSIRFCIPFHLHRSIGSRDIHITTQYELHINIFCIKSYNKTKGLTDMVKTRLKDLREDHDLLQKNLAEMLNIAQTTYSQYELSKREIPYEIIIKLASFYNTSVDYILYLTDDKKPYKRKERS